MWLLNATVHEMQNGAFYIIIIFASLDRILVSLSWESLYPLMFLKVITREVSDHSPLVLDFDLN
jgi:hypothetical protein